MEFPLGKPRLTSMNPLDRRNLSMAGCYTGSANGAVSMLQTIASEKVPQMESLRKLCCSPHCTVH